VALVLFVVSPIRAIRMKSSPRPLRTNMTPGFCWVVIALAICSFITANAEASCGDYLHVGDAGLMGEFSKSISLDQDAATGTDPIPQPLIPRPCHGPNCGRNVPLPIPPAPIPPSSGSEKFAVGNSLLHAVASRLIQALDQFDEFPSAGYPIGVKRPPRA